MPNEPHRRVEVAKMKWVRWVFGPNDQHGIYFLDQWSKCGIFQQFPWGACWRIFAVIISDFTFSCPINLGFCQGLRALRALLWDVSWCGIFMISVMRNIFVTTLSSSCPDAPFVSTTSHSAHRELLPALALPTVLLWREGAWQESHCHGHPVMSFTQSILKPNLEFSIKTSQSLLSCNKYTKYTKYTKCLSSWKHIWHPCLALPWRRLDALAHRFTWDHRKFHHNKIVHKSR